MSGTQWIMGSTFISLIACYVVLLAWAPIARAAPPSSVANHGENFSKEGATP